MKAKKLEKVKCTKCDGTGKCMECGGRGKNKYGILTEVELECFECRGQGMCTQCNGEGFVSI